jgi:hypothetical protein
MTIQIKDMTVSNEIDVSEMSAVRGGEMSHACAPDVCFTKMSVSTFTDLVNSGLLANPVNAIAAGSQVDLTPK